MAFEKKNNLQNKTALLFYDGHSSHISLRIVELALENSVELIKFPSHLTDRLQPLDKCVFGPVKKTWERLLVNHGKSNIGKAHTFLRKHEFCSLLGQLWRKINESNIISGFVSTGLFPINVGKIPTDLFDKQDLERYLRARNVQEPIEVSTQTNEPNLVVETAEQEALTRSSITTSSSEINSIFFATANTTLNDANIKKNPGTRLKHHTYGEILTSNEVISRLKIAEEKKTCKRRTVKIKKEPVDKNEPLQKVKRSTRSEPKNQTVKKT